MALTDLERERLEFVVKELKAVRRRCTISVQLVARLIEESDTNEQTNGGQIENEHRDSN